MYTIQSHVFPAASLHAIAIPESPRWSLASRATFLAWEPATTLSIVLVRRELVKSARGCDLVVDSCSQAILSLREKKTGSCLSSKHLNTSTFGDPRPLFALAWSLFLTHVNPSISSPSSTSTFTPHVQKTSMGEDIPRRSATTIMKDETKSKERSWRS